MEFAALNWLYELNTKITEVNVKILVQLFVIPVLVNVTAVKDWWMIWILRPYNSILAVSGRVVMDGRKHAFKTAKCTSLDFYLILTDT